MLRQSEVAYRICSPFHPITNAISKSISSSDSILPSSNRYDYVINKIILGAETALVWKQLEGGIFDTYEILPGLILCALAVIIVSIIVAVCRLLNIIGEWSIKMEDACPINSALKRQQSDRRR
jgi:hypothetical protein